MPALQTFGLCKRYGALTVARNIDFSLPRGARHAMIGPNGAGKTTFINLLTGVATPSQGRIQLFGEDITGLRADQRVKRGLVRTFQVTSLFPRLTPQQAVTLAVCERMGVTRRWLRPYGAYRAATDEAADILATLGLAPVAGRASQTLAYGQQRILELALALALRPRVLILDEPAAGIPAGESAALLDVIAALPEDIAVLLIEHDMSLVFRFASHLTVLMEGGILAAGSPREVADNADVRAVYLGQAGRDQAV